MQESLARRDRLLTRDYGKGDQGQ